MTSLRIDHNFIDNQFVKLTDNATFQVINPAINTPVAQVSLASHDQIQDAVQAAKKAQRSWRKMPAIERANFLRKLADQLELRKQRIGQCLANESGKSLEDATNEAVYAAEITRYHAEWARRIEGEVIPSDSTDESLLLLREPMGIVACMIPFNYPVFTLLRKIAPALITGNAVVVRPSNLTPSSAFEIGEAIMAAGFPRGIVNILAMTHETAQVLCTHPDVSMLTLTGSVEAGRKMLEYAQANIAKTSLELGGKSPAIIEPDANLSKAVQEILASRTTHAGQLCTAIERVYVHESIADTFIQQLETAFKAKTYGDRSKNPHHMGPLCSEAARQKVHNRVLEAIDQGARLHCGGVIPTDLPGFFYPPTLLSQCRQSMPIIQEEIFGPVLPLVTYSTLDEALALANDCQYGLASVLYTQKYQSIMQVAHHIEAGEIYINRTPADPYQGYHAGWKRSGLGGDDGKHGMLEYTQTRLVVLNY